MAITMTIWRRRPVPRSSVSAIMSASGLLPRPRQRMGIIELWPGRVGTPVLHPACARPCSSLIRSARLRAPPNDLFSRTASASTQSCTLDSQRSENAEIADRSAPCRELEAVFTRATAGTVADCASSRALGRAPNIGFGREISVQRRWAFGRNPPRKLAVLHPRSWLPLLLPHALCIVDSVVVP